MKRIATILILTTLGGAPLCATSTNITVQGTLKDKNGVPVNTPQNMTFSFVDGSGNPIPNTSTFNESNVAVINGLFSQSLTFDPSIPWEQYTPYVRILVNGEQLQPDQPVNANLFAISPFPQGMIAMFANSCPVGWSEFTALRGRFPVGIDPNNSAQFSAGIQGGSLVGLTNSRPVGSSGQYGPGDCMQDIGTGSTYEIRLATLTLPPYVPVIFCQKL